MRTVNKAPAYEEAKAGSGNTKVHLLEKGNPGKWGMKKNKIFVLNYRNFVEGTLPYIHIYWSNVPPRR